MDMPRGNPEDEPDEHQRRACRERLIGIALPPRGEEAAREREEQGELDATEALSPRIDSPTRFLGTAVSSSETSRERFDNSLFRINHDNLGRIYQDGPEQAHCMITHCRVAVLLLSDRISVN
jgi:hypothetical protein